MGCYGSKLKDLEFESDRPKPVIETVFLQDNNKSYILPRTKGNSPANLANVSESSIGRTNRKKDRLNAKYAFKGVIWKGTFSIVHRVEKRATKQPYAMKIIEICKGQSVFESELSVLRRVNHPNVIQLIEVIETRENICIIMELATGGTLLDRLETCGPFSEVDAVKVLKMLLSALDYLHNLGITHRDLKPDNILYYHPGSDSKIMVIDFGFSSTPKSNGNPYMHTVCGTPQYIAPEIISQRPYTSAVDMWATGVICYIILSCSFPFDADKESVIYKQILKGSYSMDSVLWDSVSDSAKKFITALLQQHPENRLTAKDAASHDWVQNIGILNQEKLKKPKLSSNRSSRSGISSASRRSSRSLRSHQHRIQTSHFESLKSDPEVADIVNRNFS